MSTARSPTPCMSVRNVKPRAAFIFRLNCLSASRSVSVYVMLITILSVFPRCILRRHSWISSSQVIMVIDVVVFRVFFFIRILASPTSRSVNVACLHTFASANSLFHCIIYCSSSHQIAFCSCWTSTLCPTSSSRLQISSPIADALSSS